MQICKRVEILLNLWCFLGLVQGVNLVSSPQSTKITLEQFLSLHFNTFTMCAFLFTLHNLQIWWKLNFTSSGRRKRPESQMVFNGPSSWAKCPPGPNRTDVSFNALRLLAAPSRQCLCCEQRGERRSFGYAMTLCVFMLSFHCVWASILLFYEGRLLRTRLVKLCIAEYICGENIPATMEDNGNMRGSLRKDWGLKTVEGIDRVCIKLIVL